MGDFAVLDLETTGLYPSTDRIVEVGVVRVSDSGRILDEYCTVVNPERDVGPTHIHGLHAADLLGAPRFAEVADDVLRMLHGAVLVAHHARFDVGFLRSEMMRIDRQVDFGSVLCTLELLYAIEPRAPRRLSDCCQYFGISSGDSHTALGDARMAAALLSELTRRWPFPALPAPLWFDALEPSGQSMSRAQTIDPRLQESTYLSELVRRLPPVAPGVVSAAAAAQYLNLLDAVLEDRRIDAFEAGELARFASDVNLTSGETKGIHAAYVASLCRAATRDGVVTASEFHDLEVVGKAKKARSLGIRIVAEAAFWGMLGH